MAKKKQIKKYTTNQSSGSEATTIVWILGGVIAVLLVTYCIACLMTGEIKLGKEQEKEKAAVEIQYDEILAGQTFNRDNSDYYVFYFDFTSNYASAYATYRESYIMGLESLPMYLVDLSKGFNQNIVVTDDETTYKEKPEKLEDLKVKGTTILKVSNKKVVERIEGKDKISDFFDKK